MNEEEKIEHNQATFFALEHHINELIKALESTKKVLLKHKKLMQPDVNVYVEAILNQVHIMLHARLLFEKFIDANNAAASHTH